MLCIEDTRILVQKKDENDPVVVRHNPQASEKELKESEKMFSEILCYLKPLLIHYTYLNCASSIISNTPLQDIYRVLRIYQPELDYPEFDDPMLVYNHWIKNPKNPFLVSFLLLRNVQDEVLILGLQGSLAKIRKLYRFDYYIDSKNLQPGSLENLPISNLTVYDLCILIDAANAFNHYSKILFKKGYLVTPCNELNAIDDYCKWFVEYHI